MLLLLQFVLMGCAILGMHAIMVSAAQVYRYSCIDFTKWCCDVELQHSVRMVKSERLFVLTVLVTLDMCVLWETFAAHLMVGWDSMAKRMGACLHMSSALVVNTGRCSNGQLPQGVCQNGACAAPYVCATGNICCLGNSGIFFTADM